MGYLKKGLRGFPKHFIVTTFLCSKYCVPNRVCKRPKAFSYAKGVNKSAGILGPKGSRAK